MQQKLFEYVKQSKTNGGGGDDRRSSNFSSSSRLGGVSLSSTMPLKQSG